MEILRAAFRKVGGLEIIGGANWAQVDYGMGMIVDYRLREDGTVLEDGGRMFGEEVHESAQAAADAITLNCDD